jgi:hypothetical protein
MSHPRGLVSYGARPSIPARPRKNIFREGTPELPSPCRLFGRGKPTVQPQSEKGMRILSIILIVNAEGKLEVTGLAYGDLKITTKADQIFLEGVPARRFTARE